MTGSIRKLSVVVPMYNEADHVGHLVDDLAVQDFDGEVELFVADGASTDGSVALLREAAAARGLALTVVDNPDRWVSHGLNACIRRCTGDLIVRLDCHTRYPPDYLRRSAAAAEETGAAAVGGVPVPIGRDRAERAAACAVDSPFGGVHWTRHGTATERVEVDNFYCGAFRPDALERAGLFDEGLVRNQDDELNYRIRATGGRLILDTSIRSFYYPRATFGGAFRQYYEYGLWKIPVMDKHRTVLSARSLAPIGLVGSLALLTVLAGRSPWARRLLAAETGVYAAAAVGFAAESVRRRDESWTLLPRVAAQFPTFHAGYGVGMVSGLVRAALGGLSRR